MTLLCWARASQSEARSGEHTKRRNAQRRYAAAVWHARTQRCGSSYQQVATVNTCGTADESTSALAYLSSSGYAQLRAYCICRYLGPVAWRLTERHHCERMWHSFVHTSALWTPMVGLLRLACVNCVLAASAGTWAQWRGEKRRRTGWAWS
jgi:hypothetical protein